MKDLYFSQFYIKINFSVNAYSTHFDNGASLFSHYSYIIRLRQLTIFNFFFVRIVRVGRVLGPLVVADNLWFWW